MTPIVAAGRIDGEYTFDEQIEREELWVTYAELAPILPSTTYSRGRHLTGNFHRWMGDLRRILLRDYHKMLHWTPEEGYYIVHPTEQAGVAASVAVGRIRAAIFRGLECINAVNENFLDEAGVANRDAQRARLQTIAASVG